jgi:D-alanine-D-alanine ligase
MGEKPSVLVLGGGPDAEREVSLVGAKGVAEALVSLGFTVHARTIERATLAELGGMPGDVVFPVLHGPWGEGGPLQDVLAALGRPFVGCRGGAARLAMDKVATKGVALRAGVPTAEFAVLNVRDEVCPLALPVVAKPIHEGSSVGVHICKDAGQWAKAIGAIREDVRVHPTRSYMVERYVPAMELTQGVLDPLGENPRLPIVAISPKAEFYDYHAKYHADDTGYVVDPKLPLGVADRVFAAAQAVAKAIGVRHLCRVDFLLDQQGTAWLLEVNTLPGFTSHSLLPMAAERFGLSYPKLCERLIECALRDGLSR